MQKRGFSTSFGVTIKERTFAAQHTRYQFNGKEYDSETETSDFGARNLDGDLGIWGARDPLADKYSDFSPYSYVNNMPIWAKDPDGKDIIILSAPKGAGGFGHAAVLIGNDKDGWRLYSKNGTNAGIGSSGASNKHPESGVKFNTLSDFANSNTNFTEEGEIQYKSAFRIATDKETDVKMAEAAKEAVGSYYNVVCNSCIDVVSDALEAGGLDPGYSTEQVSLGVDGHIESKTLNPVPNIRYKEIVKNNEGTDVSKSIIPNKDVAAQKKKEGTDKKNIEAGKKLEKIKQREQFRPKTD